MTASATGYAHQLSDIKIASSDPNIKHFKLLLQNSNDTTTCLVKTLQTKENLVKTIL